MGKTSLREKLSANVPWLDSRLCRQLAHDTELRRMAALPAKCAFILFFHLYAFMHSV